MQTLENLTLIAVADAIREDDEQATHTGEMLALSLCLKRDREHPNRWQTTWGSKTSAGLARTILAQMQESRIETAKDREVFER